MESEELRAALLAAAGAVRQVIGQIDPGKEGDAEAAKELDQALGTLVRWRAALELGEWPGRSVQAYPETRERMLDGA